MITSSKLLYSTNKPAILCGYAIRGLISKLRVSVGPYNQISEINKAIIECNGCAYFSSAICVCWEYLQLEE